MIISNIIGGIGNQMFQYAAGKAISRRLGVPLLLDVSDFVNYKLHQGFMLQRVFNCRADVATEADIKRILGWQNNIWIKRLLTRPVMSNFRRKGFVVEPHNHYWEDINSIPGESYLLGYWLTMKYFQDYATDIRQDFTFKAPLVDLNADIADQINKVNSVSIHIRRGDYAKDPKTAATQGLCSLEFYRDAIKYVSERGDTPHFFIFSDDIGWVRDNLRLDFACQYIDHNQGIFSYNDLQLMSLCEHNIIANSTFSWWGAWLNNNPNKIVVAPKAWLANVNIVSDYKKFVDDLIPSAWITM